MYVLDRQTYRQTDRRQTDDNHVPAAYEPSMVLAATDCPDGGNIGLNRGPCCGGDAISVGDLGV